jgi:flagellar motor component MotA
MTRNEFIKKYSELVLFAVRCSEKVRNEGILALENELDQEKIDTRDIFHFGLRLVLDRIDIELLKKILLNIVKQEKDEYTAKLKTIQKAAVLSIQEGYNPRMVYLTLNSYTDILPREDEAHKKLMED